LCQDNTIEQQLPESLASIDVALAGQPKVELDSFKESADLCKQLQQWLWLVDLYSSVVLPWF
jgi:hypothetical protein